MVLHVDPAATWQGVALPTDSFKIDLEAKAEYGGRVSCSSLSLVPCGGKRAMALQPMNYVA